MCTPGCGGHLERNRERAEVLVLHARPLPARAQPRRGQVVRLRRVRHARRGDRRDRCAAPRRARPASRYPASSSPRIYPASLTGRLSPASPARRAQRLRRRRGVRGAARRQDVDRLQKRRRRLLAVALRRLRRLAAHPPAGVPAVVAPRRRHRGVRVAAGVRVGAGGGVLAGDDGDGGGDAGDDGAARLHAYGRGGDGRGWRRRVGRLGLQAVRRDDPVRHARNSAQFGAIVAASLFLTAHPLASTGTRRARPSFTSSSRSSALWSRSS